MRTKWRSRGVAQFGSASGLGPEGRRFESCHPDHYADVVQLVEPQPSKLIVASSSLVVRSIDISTRVEIEVSRLGVIGAETRARSSVG